MPHSAPTIHTVSVPFRPLQVIKVEAAGAVGDMWRNFFLEYEQHGSDTAEGKPRRWSSLFEVANLGKASVQIDYTSPEGVKILKAILQDADVLITNVRHGSLKRSGLDQESLRKEFPHLIYGHVSAYGVSGPETLRPGAFAMRQKKRNGGQNRKTP